jgi:molybdopterin-guanine dinucleotide biosynthesis protein A
MGEDDVVMMTDFAGRDHPLVALWCRRAAPTIREAVVAGRFKVRGLLADLAVRRLGPAEVPGIDLDRALFNLNRPEDLGALHRAG